MVIFDIRVWIFAIAAWCAIILGAGKAWSQDQKPATPQVLALMNRINQEVTNNLQCVENVVTLQRQVEDLKEQLKKATEKSAQ